MNYIFETVRIESNYIFESVRIESNQFEFESVRIKLYIRISSNQIESNQSTIRIRFEFDLNETNQKLSDSIRFEFESIRIGSNFIDSFGTLIRAIKEKKNSIFNLFKSNYGEDCYGKR